MVVLYVAASLFIILTNLDKLPGVLSSMFGQAFSPDAAYGGFIGALVTGIKRAVFSNEGGVGSAAIAHSAAKTDEPVREGIVAMIGPFIDTIVVCFMTASVILITADINPIYHEARNLSLDITKAKRILGWKPRWPLSKAIDKIVEWHKAHLEGRDCLALTRKQIEEFLKQ